VGSNVAIIGDVTPNGLTGGRMSMSDRNVLVHMALSVRAAAMPVNVFGRMVCMAVGWQPVDMLRRMVHGAAELQQLCCSVHVA
jgi:hypothetical protein